MSQSETAPTNPPLYFPTIPTSREYVHAGCGGRTTISGGDFLRLVNPRDQATKTFCAACGQLATFDQFSWIDTGENLAAYRQRLATLPPHSGKRVWWVRPLVVIGPTLLLALILEIVMRFKSANDRPGAGLQMGAMIGFLGGAGTVILMNRANPIDYRAYR